MKTYKKMHANAQARNNETETTEIMDEVPKSPCNENYRIHAKDRKTYEEIEA